MMKQNVADPPDYELPADWDDELRVRLRERRWAARAEEKAELEDE